MIDRAKLEARLSTLRSEHATGTKLVQELAAKQAEIAQTLLRIGGAIQVLEEVLAADVEHEHEQKKRAIAKVDQRARESSADPPGLLMRRYEADDPAAPAAARALAVQGVEARWWPTDHLASVIDDGRNVVGLVVEQRSVEGRQVVYIRSDV